MKNRDKDKKMKKIIADCVGKLYAYDNYLFKNVLCERCLMFRCAHYLQNEFSEYIVDCEFNKINIKGSINNKIECKEDNCFKKMHTDIIIHKRNENSEDNFICIELKRKKIKIANDIERLKMMTRNESFSYGGKDYIYSYEYGFLVYLPKEKSKHEIMMFENGKESPE